MLYIDLQIELVNKDGNKLCYYVKKYVDETIPTVCCIRFQS